MIVNADSILVRVDYFVDLSNVTAFFLVTIMLLIWLHHDLGSCLNFITYLFAKKRFILVHVSACFHRSFTVFARIMSLIWLVIHGLAC